MPEQKENINPMVVRLPADMNVHQRRLFTIWLKDNREDFEAIMHELASIVLVNNFKLDPEKFLDEVELPEVFRQNRVAFVSFLKHLALYLIKHFNLLGLLKACADGGTQSFKGFTVDYDGGHAISFAFCTIDRGA